MTAIRQIAAMGAACFRPATAQTVAGAVLYLAYLGWVGAFVAPKLGTTTFVHMLLAVVTLGAWVGGCVGRVRAAPAVVLVPGYGRATTVAATIVAVAGLGGNVAVAHFIGLDVASFAAFGFAALAVSLVGGVLLPGAAAYVHIVMWLATVPGDFWVRDVPVFTGAAHPDGMWLAASLICGGAFFAAFAVPDWFGRPAVRRAARAPRGGVRWPRRLWEPSFVRVGAVFAALAVGAAVFERVLGVDLADSQWIVLIGTLCVNAGATGASMALPRGPLAAASRFLVLGAAGRSGVGRRVQRKIAGDALWAVAVFAAGVVVFGLDVRLLAMVLVGFGCTSVYLVVAGGVQWLMASRLSGLVATPAVAGLTLAAWELGSWGLPGAAAFWIVAAAAAVLAGGIGIGRLDFDLGLTRETTQE